MTDTNARLERMWYRWLFRYEVATTYSFKNIPAWMLYNGSSHVAILQPHKRLVPDYPPAEI